MNSPMHSRPLSPHLQVYRFMLTMALSIFHRMTGAGLYFGSLIFVWWLVAAAMGPEAYGQFMAIARSIVGRVVLFGLSFAILHHMLGGLRHLVWDTGRGFNLKCVEISARVLVASSLSLTIGLWLLAYWIRG
jgi:succinate dehydrogenase / fumarate reductase, cytochrome b subunit